jgi:hypothetical protein
MIAYGESNLESFLVRSYTLYNYARYDQGRDIVRVTSVPGRYAMLIRSVVSLGTLLLTCVY